MKTFPTNFGLVKTGYGPARSISINIVGGGLADMFTSQVSVICIFH